ncbi:solute carrier family 45 member 4 isoform X1 [Oncorhynchus mykiss]|uniref:Solute carrier family 45 member 4b n=2 Tax=Oncorhynchus mykiss TaxID=8022 RepID=A0A8K9XRI7_ONCMY|nr:solute carrier family 45 member 4 isoform X1 [Oncorhynchus mykiss]
MVPQKADLTVLPCQDVVEMPVKKQSSERDEESPDGSLGEGAGGERIPLRKWVMHGAVMFGREFCYAMETALVTPVLLQIGLPEQYYSLTWFLSPILGLILTPLIGSASDRCTLKWGRRRPFILALCVGVLLGVSLFLNGSLLGLALGDVPSSQPIGIVLTVLGVVLLDFSADASDGPIRAYLLDVADTEEQDMALNIHAFSAGLGGAVGYVLGGLDWTSTILGTAFKSQEQILFVFAAVIFTISVILHMFSIKEESFEARGDTLGEGDSDSLSSSEKLKGGLAGPRSVPQLDVIGEEDAQSERELFINVDRVRSKSDSVLAMPDATIELDSDLDQDGHFLADIEPSIFQDYPQDLYPGTPQRHYSGWGIQDLEGPQAEAQANSQLPLFHQDPSPYYSREHMLFNNQTNQGAKCLNGASAALAVPSNHTARGANSQGRMPGLRPSNTSTTTGPRRFPFYRQPSFTFSYYGRVGSARYRHRRNTMGNPAGANLRIKTSQSMNDIYEHMRQRRELQQSSTTLSSGDSERDDGDQGGTTVKLLWLSMLKMPPQLLRLCVCHLLTWFSIIAEAVFYTDFMGQVIYAGDPTAPANSTDLQNYHKGVQMGCWGLVVYAATAAVCSAVLQKYLDNYDLSIKVIYILGTLSFSLGTAVMAIFPNVYVAMVMISTMGIISMSISYCPYALLGQYHENKQYIHHSPGKSRRGFGIDCAILSCQVYIAQILVASALSTVVDAVGSVLVIPMMASGGSFLGFLTSTFLVIYPDSSTPTTTQDQEGYGEEGSPALVAPEPDPSGSSMQQPVVLLKTSPKGSSSTAHYESTI